MMIQTAVLAASLMVAAPAPDAPAADAPPASDPLREVDCKSCKFACPTGTTNCWSCGSRVPGSKDPGKLMPRKLIVIDVLVRERSAGTSPATGDPMRDVEAVEKWIDENPNDRAGALKRLGKLLDEVRGTAYAPHVEGRIAKVRSAIEEASQPMTAAEREKRAESIVFKMLPVITRRRDEPALNIRDLKSLLPIVKGTSFEGIVNSKIRSEKAKLNR